MCPHGYHHSGSMATPALGTRDVRLHIVWIALWSHQSAQTVSSERCIVPKLNVPQGGSPPNPKECSNCTGSERNIQRITMCPHGYHHSGSMATPALGTRDVRLHIVWIALWSHQSAQTVSSERCIVPKVNVPQGGSPPNPKECSNCTGSERNIQRITRLQCALTAITTVALWQLPHLGHGMCVYIYIYIYIYIVLISMEYAFEKVLNLLGACRIGRISDDIRRILYIQDTTL